MYVDTSVVIATADDQDEFHSESVRFLRHLRNRSIPTAIGPPFFLEAAKAAEMRGSEAASRLARTVEEHEIEAVENLDDWLWNLVDQYLSHRILGVGRFIDLMHYASATLLRCDCLASWDRGHFNGKVAMKINKVNSSAGLASLIVWDPTEVERYLGLG